MSRTVTLEDVWKAFLETDRKMQETDRKMQETDRKMQETDLRLRTTNEETDRMIREMSVETARRQQETDRLIQETARRQQETDRLIQKTSQEIEKVNKQLNQQIGKLGGRMGEFVEGLVAPACKTLFVQRGIPAHKVSRRMEAELPGDRRMEIDLFVVNTNATILVEVKSKLTVEDVRDHLSRLEAFKEFFPEYADKRTMGAVAAMVIEEKVVNFAIKKGLFVLMQTGETIHLANDADFTPREW
ncbi:MAG: hypothetical protein HQL76_00185 [Magnetococcales bacterium]|nr:hypothetical protein [Magnetococcales bacterium]